MSIDDPLSHNKASWGPFCSSFSDWKGHCPLLPKYPEISWVSPTFQILWRSNLEQRKNRVPPQNENLQRPLGLGQGAPQTTPPVASHIRHKKLPADHFCYSSAGCLQRLPLCVPVAKHTFISGGGLWWIRNHVVEAGCKLSISNGCSLTFTFIGWNICELFPIEFLENGQQQKTRHDSICPTA